MDVLKAKETVIEAGKKLVEYGLIARTWGNVSCRISDTQFVITPSGKPYEGLTPDDIVVVNMADLSYEGDVKPSSEKGIHAQCYILRPEVNFVIHTHQMNASVVSAIGLDIRGLEGREKEIIGDEILMGGYGLPGTKTLREGVVNALERTSSNAVIMAHHGALCLGKDYDEAFAVAGEVEKVCMKFVLRRYKELTGKTAEALETAARFLSDKFRTGEQAVQLEKYDSMREGTMVTLLDKEGNIVSAADYTLPAEEGDGGFIREAAVHYSVYRVRKDVNYIIHADEANIHAYSVIGKKMKPLLDDFAQIAGATVKCVAYKDSKKTIKKIGSSFRFGRNAVILKDNGALCAGIDKYNAQATEMVVEKNARAYTGAQLFGIIDPINPIESKIMNVVYRLKYSKQAKK